MTRLRAALAALLVSSGPSLGRAPPAEVVARATDMSEIRSRLAWSLLVMGKSDAALRQFVRLAGALPESGEFKVGLALAAADSGDLSGGARAMRRALRTAPESVATVVVDPRLSPCLERLTSRYVRWLARRDDVGQDATLMLASLYFLRRDLESARYAIELGRVAGDRSPSVDNLEKLIDGLERPPPQEASLDPEQPPMEPPPFAQDTASLAAEPPLAVIEPDEGDEETSAPETPAAEAPREPVDFDRLLENVAAVNGALDRFTRKLLAAMAAAKGQGRKNSDEVTK